MKNLLLLTTFVIACFAGSAGATTFADADYFGGVHSDGLGHNDVPNGIQLSARDYASGAFDFVLADGTSSFTIGSPYAVADQGTYTSQLGYVLGTPIDPDTLYFTFFFRDPNGGNEQEKINLGPGDLIFRGGRFTGAWTLDFGGDAAVAGNIAADGSVSYRVRATSGEFVLDGAYGFLSVPETGFTLAYLGLGVALCLVCFRKTALSS